MPHSVADLATKHILAGVVDDAIEVISTGEVVDDGHLACFVRLPCAQILQSELVVAIIRLGVPNDLEAGDLRLEPCVLSNSVLLCGVLHHAEDLSSHGVVVDAGARPGALRRCARPLERLLENVAAAVAGGGAEALVAREGKLGAIPDVKCPDVRLHPGVLRGRVEPRVSAGLGMSVEHDDVLVLVVHIHHGHLRAGEASADDAHWVWPTVARVFEVHKAVDDHIILHVRDVLELLALRGRGGELGAGLEGEDRRERLRQVSDLGVGEHRHEEGLVRSLDPQGAHFVPAGRLAWLIHARVLLALQHHHVALKLVEEGVPRLRGILQIFLEQIFVDHVEVLVVEGLHDLVGVRVQGRLALRREQRELERRAVGNDHGAWHHSEPVKNGLRHQSHDLATHGAADERERRPLELTTLLDLPESGQQGLEGVCGEGLEVAGVRLLRA
mmetsp:Transcript_47923/g.137565  ORF Transcript_47923/g.137565 Transcript_47923/m.137565 type:complete len:443 (-) Transcript_47923:228-1556(-)